ncbi:phosphohistidine phosphatase SixA [bacterium]|nr:phosphohistidine phosphatase SixA [bacterium]MCI0605815.1 phosphohistidine phosphatase SixA [bacterium]
MRIFILRHAIAEDSAKGGDSQRALSEEGRRKMRDAAAGFARLELEIDAIYSSPLVRAVQTAEILARAISYSAKIETMQELAPGHSPESVGNRLRSLKKSGNIVLSGHEPNCSELASFLSGGAQIEFKKGAICLIETESTTAGSGILIWHLSPQVLRLMKS